MAANVTKVTVFIKLLPFSWLLVLLLSTIVAAFVDRCEKGEIQITSSENKYGTFSTPGWPKHYPEDIRCVYKFVGRPHERVYIRFDFFNVEGLGPRCKKDFVDMYLEIRSIDEPLSQARLLGRFCGHSSKSVPSQLVSLYNILVLDLFSDQNTQRVYNNDVHMGQLGFNASYEFLDSKVFTFGSPLPGASDCSFIISSAESPSGTVRSPTYPGLYPDNMNCTYVFRGRSYERVKVEFTDFDLYEMTDAQLSEAEDIEVASCPVDAIRFYDSTQRIRNQQIARPFCGSQTGLTVFSTDTSLRMEFITGTGRIPRDKDPRDHGDWRELQRRGFKLKYTFNSKFVNTKLINPQFHWKGTECDYIVNSEGKSRGSFTFPALPHDKICTLFFQGLHNRQQTEIIRLSMDRYIEVPVNSTCPTSSGLSILVYLNGQSIRASADKRLCYAGPSSNSQVNFRSKRSQIFLIVNTTVSNASNMRLPDVPRIYVNYKFVTDFGIPGDLVREDECSVVYRSIEYPKGGTTNSPFYDKAARAHYPFNQTCTYRFIASKPHKERIRIRFTDFYVSDYFMENVGKEKLHHTAGTTLPCEVDYVNVYETLIDSRGVKTNILILTYCGTAIPGPYVSEFQSDEIVIKFVSVWEENPHPVVGRRTGGGFEIVFDFPPKTDLFSNRKEADCGGNITSSDFGGTITTPNFPYRYPDNLICEWHIYPFKAKKGQVYVQFPEFHLEGSTKSCSMAVVRLYNGHNVVPSSELCGADTNIPTFPTADTLVNHDFLRLRLTVVPRNKGGKGFQLSWTEVLAVDPRTHACPGFRCKKTGFCIDHSLECNSYPNCGSYPKPKPKEQKDMDLFYTSRHKNFTEYFRDMSDEKVNSAKCNKLYAKPGPSDSNYQLLHVGIGVILTVILLIVLIIYVLCREHKKTHKKSRTIASPAMLDLHSTRQHLMSDTRDGFATVRNGHSTATLTREKMQKISIV